MACHRDVKQGAAGRPPHLATSLDTGAQRHWPAHRVTGAASPSQGTRSAHRGPLTGAAAVPFSVTHGPLAPDHTARLLLCCIREPRTSWGWVLCSLSPGLLAERRESI